MDPITVTPELVVAIEEAKASIPPAHCLLPADGEVVRDLKSGF